MKKGKAQKEEREKGNYRRKNRRNVIIASGNLKKISFP